MSSVAAYVRAGLKSGGSAVLFATAEHLSAIEHSLALEWTTFARARAEGRYFPVDAKIVLTCLRHDGELDEPRVRAELGGTLDQARSAGRPLRVFGECVALLWAQGNQKAALRLEQLWNELAGSPPFSLLCAYPMRLFQGAEHGQGFSSICSLHSQVVPTETYLMEPGTDARLRRIGLLQQKASSLGAESVQRWQAESDLRVEHTRADLAVTIAGLGIWELDPATSQVTCSEPCKLMLGLPQNQPLTCEHLWTHVHPTDRPAVEAALRASLDHGSEYRAEFRVLHAGRTRWLASLGRFVQNGPSRLLAVMQDITERKENLDLLEQNVAERTAQLREANSELEAFSYSISHDLRAPLRAMQGLAKAVLEDHAPTLPPEAASHLQMIRQAAERMDQLIRDVLRYSKLAKADVHLEPIPLEPFLNDLLGEWPEFARARNCIVVQSPLHVVMAHEACLTQCLKNLIGNALKFVPPGRPPRIRVRSDVVGDRVKTSVTDNGIGISPGHRSKIFKLFSRLHPQTAYEGTGIGLAIVKKAVSRMGGEVGFESVPGAGSTFWFILPTPPSS